MKLQIEKENKLNVEVKELHEKNKTIEDKLNAIIGILEKQDK